MWVQKPEEQDHWQCKGTREDRCLSSRRQGANPPFLWPYSSPPAQIGRDARLGGRSAFLILPTQMLISSRYTLTAHPENHVANIWAPCGQVGFTRKISHCIRLYCGPHLCLPPDPRRPRVSGLPWAPSSQRPLQSLMLPHLLWALTQVPHPQWGFRQPSVLNGYLPHRSLSLPHVILSLALITILYNLFLFEHLPQIGCKL